MSLSERTIPLEPNFTWTGKWEIRTQAQTSSKEKAKHLLCFQSKHIKANNSTSCVKNRLTHTFIHSNPFNPLKGSIFFGSCCLFFLVVAAWLNVSVVRAVALLSYKWVKMSQNHWIHISKKSNKVKNFNEPTPNHICSLPESVKGG